MFTTQRHSDNSKQIRHGEGSRATGRNRLQAAVESLEGRTLLSGGGAGGVNAVFNLITGAGIVNSAINLKGDSDSQIKALNDVVQGAAGASSINSAVQFASPLAQSTTMTTNGFAFALGYLVLQNDLKTANLSTAAGQQMIESDIITLCGDAAGVAGGACHLLALYDPVLEFPALVLDVAGAHATILGIIADRNPTGSDTENLTRTMETSLKYTAGKYSGTASSQVDAAVNGTDTALDDAMATANAMGTANFAADAKATASALGAAATPLNNLVDASKPAAGTDTLTVNGNSFSLTGAKSAILLKGSVTENKTANPSTASVAAKAGTLTLSGKATSNNTTGDTTISVVGGSSTKLSVSGKIVGKTGAASETVSGSGTGADVTGGTVTVAKGTKAAIVGNGDTITGASGDTINTDGTGNTVSVNDGTVNAGPGSTVTVDGSGNTINGQPGDTVSLGGTGTATGDADTVNMSSGNVVVSTSVSAKIVGSSDSVTESGNNDQVSLDGSNDHAIVTGNNDTTYLQNSTDTATDSGSGDTTTGPGSTSSGNFILSLGSTSAIASYAGIGFQENAVGVLYASLNGQPDTNAAGLAGTINWGDGASSSADLVYQGISGTYGTYLIKGTHIYAAAGNQIPINVTASAGGKSVSSRTCDADVSPMPSGMPGQPPAATSGSAAPENVLLNLGSTSAIASYAGVGFEENQVSVLYASVNGQPDPTLGDFHAQINWGDSSSWDSGSLVYDGISGTYAVYLIKGSHVYQQTGSEIPVVVYVNGPDKTSVSGRETDCNVSAMPSGIPGQKPSTTSTAAPENVLMSLGSTSAIATKVGQAVSEAEVAVVYIAINGEPATSISDVQAQINWGDSGSWSSADLISDGTSGTYAVYKVLGTHTYTKASSHIPVVVYVTGPDGTSISGQSSAAVVSAA